MGDSYSAGNGAGSHFDRTGATKYCWRSSKNYAGEFRRLVEQAPSRQRAIVDNIACSGDRTIDFFARRGGRPPQIQAVNRSYDVIFLTLGGNDLNFAKIVKFCLVAQTRDGERCETLLDAAQRILQAKGDDSLERHITSVLSAVGRAADARARIVLLGYPYLEGDSRYKLHYTRRIPGRPCTRGGCPSERVPVNVGRDIREIGRDGDTLQARVVRRLNKSNPGRFVFVKTKNLFAGKDNKAYGGRRQQTHELFAHKMAPDPWFVKPYFGTAFQARSRDMWYHPNARGWHEEAALLLRTPGVPTRDVNSDQPAGPGPGEGGSPGGGEGFGGGGAGDGAAPGDGEPGEIDLGSAVAGYLFSRALPSGGGYSGATGAVARDLPSGLRLSHDAGVVGVPNVVGRSVFDAFWLERDEVRGGQFGLSVKLGPPTIAQGALSGLGISEQGWAYCCQTIHQLRRSPDGRYLAVSLGLTEVLAIYDTVTAALTPLTAGTWDSANGYGGWPANLSWSPDGRSLAFTSEEPLTGLPASLSYRVFLYDLDTRAITLISEPTAQGFNPVWSPDGRILAYNRMTNKHEVATYDVQRAVSSVLPCPDLRLCRMIASQDDFSTEPWSADSRYLTFVSALESRGYYDPDAVETWDRITGTTRTIASDVHGSRLSPDGRSAVTTDSERTVRIIDVPTGSTLKTFAGAGLYGDDSGMTSVSQWAPDGHVLTGWACQSIGCGPATLDVDTGSIGRIGDSSYAVLAGWNGNSPVWCGRPDQMQISCRGIEGVAGDQITTVVPSPLILGTTPDGYYGQWDDPSYRLRGVFFSAWP